jgi:cullin 3
MTYCNGIDKPTPYGLAIKAFRDNLQQPFCGNGDEVMTLQGIVTRFVVDQIERDRSGELVDRNILGASVQMLKDLSEYVPYSKAATVPFTAMETELLETSQIFYREEAKMWLSEATVGAYCRQVARRVDEER